MQSNQNLPLYAKRLREALFIDTEAAEILMNGLTKGLKDTAESRNTLLAKHRAESPREVETEDSDSSSDEDDGSYQSELAEEYLYGTHSQVVDIESMSQKDMQEFIRIEDDDVYKDDESDDEEVKFVLVRQPCIHPALMQHSHNKRQRIITIED